MKSTMKKVALALGLSVVFISAHATSVSINEIAYQNPSRVSYDVYNSSNTAITIFAVTNNDDSVSYADSTRAGWSGYRVTKEQWDNEDGSGQAGLHFGVAGQSNAESQNDPMKYVGGSSEYSEDTGAVALGSFAELFGSDNTDNYVHVYWIRFDNGYAIGSGERSQNQFWFYEGFPASVAAAWGSKKIIMSSNSF